MNITDTRRANLAAWVKANGIPQKEKSLFSQLRGEGSFGEKVARRLERDYKMGEGFLDSQAATQDKKLADTPAAPETKGFKPVAISGIERDGIPDQILGLVMVGAISHREAVLIHRHRTASEDGKGKIDLMASVVERDPLLVVHDKANS